MKWNHFLVILTCSGAWQACSSTHGIEQLAKKELNGQENLHSAHLGICIFDPEKNNYLYNYQADKFFIPASNTKLFSLYAGMKYLGDSLVGIRYIPMDSDILVLAAGDPSLLHPDFPNQPVIDFLRKAKGSIYISAANWQEEGLGPGWSWDDYNDDYAQERSPLPVYGNSIRWIQVNPDNNGPDSGVQSVPYVFSIPEINWKVQYNTDTLSGHFYVKRKKDENFFELTQGKEKSKTQDVPFVTHGIESAIELLKDTLGKSVFPEKNHPLPEANRALIIHSRPVDSLFRPMMYRSDNFFAEQTLLMTGNELLGKMNDRQIIDTLLKKDLAALPQKPNWADGSGLSRYNLFTPQDFVWLLNTLKKEFGMERIKNILPTGGRGTLGSRYKQDSGYIYAKTGSLTGVIALSGYLYTRRNHLLIFSVLVNNQYSGGGAIRDETAAFLHSVREKY